MKRPLFLAILICLSALTSFSQDRGYINLSIGPAFPVGEFANKDESDPKSGLANLGPLLDISYMGRRHNSHFGFTASVLLRMNSISSSALLEPFESLFPGYNWSVTKKPWEAGAAMVGIYWHYPITTKIHFEGALLFGVAETMLPQTTVIGIKDTGVNHTVTDLVEATTQKKYATTFSQSIRMGIGYKLTEKLGLQAGMSFWYLKPTFKQVTQTIVHAQGFAVPGNLSLQNASSISVGQFIADYNQNMSSLNFTVGVAVKL
jgi:hypothetical protein